MLSVDLLMLANEEASSKVFLSLKCFSLQASFILLVDLTFQDP